MKGKATATEPHDRVATVYYNGQDVMDLAAEYDVHLSERNSQALLDGPLVREALQRVAYEAVREELSRLIKEKFTSGLEPEPDYDAPSNRERAEMLAREDKD